MRKIGKFDLVVGVTLMFMTLPIAALAQVGESLKSDKLNKSSDAVQVGVNFGTRIWWARENQKINYPSTGLEGNFFIEIPIKEIIVRGGAGIGYLNKARTYSNEKQWVGSDVDFFHKERWSISENGCAYFSVPIQLVFNGKRVKPFVGIEFNNLLTSVHENSSVLLFNSTGQFENTESQSSNSLTSYTKDIAPQIGMYINLSKKMAIKIDYYYGLLSNHVHGPNQQYINHTYKNSALGFSFQYRWDTK